MQVTDRMEQQIEYEVIERNDKLLEEIASDSSHSYETSKKTYFNYIKNIEKKNKKYMKVKEKDLNRKIKLITKIYKKKRKDYEGALSYRHMDNELRNQINSDLSSIKSKEIGDLVWYLNNVEDIKGNPLKSYNNLTGIGFKSIRDHYTQRFLDENVSSQFREVFKDHFDGVNKNVDEYNGFCQEHKNGWKDAFFGDDVFGPYLMSIFTAGLLPLGAFIYEKIIEKKLISKSTKALHSCTTYALMKRDEKR